MAYLHIANRIPPRILILSPFLTWIKAIKPIAAPQPTTDMIINARIDRNESRGKKIEKKGISFSSVVSGNGAFKENKKCPNNNNLSIQNR